MAARILIVEDEVLTALGMQAILQDLGYQTIGIAEDMLSAKAYWDHDFELALVDLNLRDGATGFHIGNRFLAAGVTVVFMTAQPFDLSVGALPALALATKPTDEITLRSTIEYALRMRAGDVCEPPAEIRILGKPLMWARTEPSEMPEYLSLRD